MDMRGAGRGRGRFVSCASYLDFSSVRMTVTDLRRPGHSHRGGWWGGGGAGVPPPLLQPRVIHNTSLHLDGLRYAQRYEAEAHKITDPYSPLCMIPLPGNMAIHAAAEPSFIRKRNERERERVRCVNDGYEQLKDHLPNASKDKRISKVETLRGAIDYIRHMEKVLKEGQQTQEPTDADDVHSTPERPGEQSGRGEPTRPRKSSAAAAAAAAKAAVKTRMVALGNGDRTCRKRRGSLSSEQSMQSDGTLSESETNLFRRGLDSIEAYMICA